MLRSRLFFNSWINFFDRYLAAFQVIPDYRNWSVETFRSIFGVNIRLEFTGSSFPQMHQNFVSGAALDHLLLSDFLPRKVFR